MASGDQDHLVYINGETQLAQLEKTLRFPGLQEAAEALRDNPNPEGYTIKGPKRTCGRLFVPDLTFGKHIEMGENVFFYMGEMAECYVIYWPGKPVTEDAPWRNVKPCPPSPRSAATPSSSTRPASFSPATKPPIRRTSTACSATVPCTP